MKMMTYKKLFALCLSMAVVTILLIPTAIAGEAKLEVYAPSSIPLGSPAVYSERNPWPLGRIPGVSTPDQYSRAGATKTLRMQNYTLINPGYSPAFPNTSVTFSGSTPAASVTFTCDSSGTFITSGNWTTSTLSGYCWPQHSRTFPNGVTVTTPANRLDNGTDNVGTPFQGYPDYAFGTYTTNCPGTVAQSLGKQDCTTGTAAQIATCRTNAAYCIHNYVPPLGVTGVTGDDMFSIAATAGAFFEYKKLPLTDDARLIYIERNDTTRTNNLMMPSGPAPAAGPPPVIGFTDYRRFVNNPPTSAVSIERACYPTNFSLCGAPKYPPVCGVYADSDVASPPIKAACTVAEFQSNMAANNRGCYSGSVAGGGPTVVSGKFVWTCAQGATSRSCTGDISPGTCGSAAGGTFAAAPTSGLCGCGQKATGVSQSGNKWVWTCRNPLNNQSSSCNANLCQPQGGTFHIQANCTGRNNYPNCGAHCNCVEGLYGGTTSYYGGVLCCGRGISQAGFTTQGGMDCDCHYKCK